MIKRIIHYYLDIFFIIIFAYGLIVILEDFFEFKNVESVFMLLYLSTFVLYYVFFELIFNKTIAKYFTKTKVIFMNDKDSKISCIIKRTFLRLVPFDMISFLLTEDKQFWHDKYSNTKVISDI